MTHSEKFGGFENGTINTVSLDSGISVEAILAAQDRSTKRVNGLLASMQDSLQSLDTSELQPGTQETIR